MSKLEEIVDNLVFYPYGVFSDKENGRVAEEAISDIKAWAENPETVTRFEVIDEEGRQYVNNNCSIRLSYQDDNRTLKVFIEKTRENIRSSK